ALTNAMCAGNSSFTCFLHRFSDGNGRKSPTAADAKLLLSAHHWLHVHFGCALSFEGIVVQYGRCRDRWSSNFLDAFSGREIAEFGRDRELNRNDKHNQRARHKKVFHVCASDNRAKPRRIAKPRRVIRVPWLPLFLVFRTRRKVSTVP